MNKGTGLLIALLLLVIVASNSLFIVKETERAVLLEFGAISRSDIQPGLHWKIPIVHTVRKFDSRIQTVDSSPQRFLTLEKKSLVVDSYAKWRIAEVERFYTATNGEEARAVALLAQRINTGLRNQFGQRTMHEVVSGERDQLMQELTHEMDGKTREELGISIVDIRVKRIDLPEAVSQSVYHRMVTEREREARDLRSRGKELAEGIKAAADREKTIIESEAYREAEQIRGDGDAQAAKIYAQAFSQDPEFYAFIRSLNAYRDTFQDKSDLLLLDPNSEFFRYLKKAKGE